MYRPHRMAPGFNNGIVVGSAWAPIQDDHRTVAHGPHDHQSYRLVLYVNGMAYFPAHVSTFFHSSNTYIQHDQEGPKLNESPNWYTGVYA